MMLLAAADDAAADYSTTHLTKRALVGQEAFPRSARASGYKGAVLLYKRRTLI